MIKGFTLIEIIIILAIIGILALVGFTTFLTVGPSLALNAEVRDTASDLRLAQQMAVNEQVIYNVSFNIALNRYAIINETTAETVKTKTIGRQVLLSAINGLDDDKARFNATGAVLTNGSVVFSNSAGKTATIQINPSGYAKIQN